MRLALILAAAVITVPPLLPGEAQARDVDGRRLERMGRREMRREERIEQHQQRNLRRQTTEGFAASREPPRPAAPYVPR